MNNLLNSTLIQETWQIISCNKWRSILTASGVFWGVFIMIILMAGGTLIGDIYDNMLNSFNNHTIYIKLLPTTKPYKGYSEGRNISLCEQDMKRLEKLEYLGIKKIGYQMTIGKENLNPVVHGHYSNNFFVTGVNSTFLECFPMQLTDGCKFTERHDAEQCAICMIGNDIAVSLFPNQDPIGQYISVLGYQFMVIGVCRSISPIASSIDPSQSVFIPLNLAQLLFGAEQSEIRSVFFLFQDDVDIDSKIDECRSIIANMKDVDQTDTQSISAFNMAKFCSQSNTMRTGLVILIILGGIGMLIAGIVGVSSIMLVTVKERTRDIALRSVLGASKWDICKLVLSESMFITMISGMSGFCAAVAVIQITRNYIEIIGINPHYLYLPFHYSVISLIIIIIGGFNASIYPLYRALSVQVIDALYNE